MKAIKSKAIKKTKLEKLDRICQILKEKNLTRQEIWRDIDVCRSLLQKYLLELVHDERIHIVRYIATNDDDGKPFRYCHAALYSLGKGVNAQRKTTKVKEVICENGATVTYANAKSKPFPKNTDPLMRALYGMI